MKGITYLLKELVRLLQVQIMIKECNEMIRWKHACGLRKDIVSEKEKIWYNNIMKWYKNVNFDGLTKENIKEHNPSWPQIPGRPYRTLIIGGCGSGKTNSLFNLINLQPDIDKISLCAKDPYEGKYQFLINKQESKDLT